MMNNTSEIEQWLIDETIFLPQITQIAQIKEKKYRLFYL